MAQRFTSEHPSEFPCEAARLVRDGVRVVSAAANDPFRPAYEHLLGKFAIAAGAGCGECVPCIPPVPRILQVLELFHRQMLDPARGCSCAS